MKRSSHGGTSLVPAVALMVVLTAGLAANPAHAQGSASDERLLEAAQQGDLEVVKELLAAGIDIDTGNRYGATALFFAAFRGNVEMVELLLENGAEVNVRDTFYNATPTTWAMSEAQTSEAHRKILELLLEAGSKETAVLVQYGIQRRDADWVQRALEVAELDRAQLRTALDRARAAEAEEIVELLEARMPERVAAFEVSREELESYAGDYRNEDLGMTLKIFLEEEVLKGQVIGQPSFSLSPTGEDQFESLDIAGISMQFSGRAGTVERLQLSQGGQQAVFVRSTASPMTLRGDAPAVDVSASADLPEVERKAGRPWPGFRGSAASGIADGQGIATEWDGPSGRNVRWKTRIQGLALSSPIVWGDRIFLTTAASADADSTFRTGLYGDVDSVDDDSVHAWRLIAVDKSSGEILWQQTASEGAPKVKRHLKSSHANPTPVTDGRHVVAMFGSEGLYCYDFSGRLLWKKDLGVLSSGWFYDPTFEWGFSSSPILHDGKVIVQVDIQKGSFIAAYDVRSGEELWRTERDEIPTWGTPNILPARSAEMPDEIVTNGTTIRAYSAETGDLLWWLGPNGEVTVATPVVVGDRVYITANYPPARPIYVVNSGARGDLTLPEGETASEHVLWSRNPGGSYIPTPIVYDGLLYVLQMNGRLTCYEALTGEIVYRQRVGSAVSFASSGVAADGKLYFTTETGTTYVVKAGREFALLATNEIDEVVMSTPALSDGLLVLRGLEHLYGIGE